MKLLLADDHTLFREGFSMIISSTIAGSEIFPANDWDEALENLRGELSHSRLDY